MSLRPNKFYAVGSWRDIAKAFLEAVIGLVIFGSLWMILALWVR